MLCLLRNYISVFELHYMISKFSKPEVLSPEVYQKGFQEALQELDRYETIKNRLLTIRAHRKLIAGETFVSELLL